MYGANVTDVYRCNIAQGWADCLKRGNYVYWLGNDNHIRVGKIDQIHQLVLRIGHPEKFFAKVDRLVQLGPNEWSTTSEPTIEYVPLEQVRSTSSYATTDGSTIYVLFPTYRKLSLIHI